MPTPLLLKQDKAKVSWRPQRPQDKDHLTDMETNEQYQLLNIVGIVHEESNMISPNKATRNYSKFLLGLNSILKK